jgi:hypothetical protein
MAFEFTALNRNLSVGFIVNGTNALNSSGVTHYGRAKGICQIHYLQGAVISSGKFRFTRQYQY